MLKTYMDVLTLKMVCGAKKFFKNEKGDTNFISILIVLGIVVLLAGLFIGFKEQIVGQVQDIVENFTINPGKSENPEGPI